MAKKKKATRGRPKGTKRPGSRPDLKSKVTPAPPGSPEAEPIEMVLQMDGNMSILSAAMQLKKAAFLKAFAIQGTKYHACQAANVARTTIDGWLKEDPEFREAFNVAREDSTDIVEHGARVRAVAGIQRSIYYKGKPIGTRTEHSDVLTIVLLKAYRPEKFRERFELTGGGGGPIEVSNPIQRLQAKLAEIKARSLGLLSAGPEDEAGGQIPGNGSGLASDRGTKRGTE